MGVSVLVVYVDTEFFLYVLDFLVEVYGLVE